MNFCEEYPKLEAAQQEKFRAVVTRLLSGHVLSPGASLAPDADWRFAERFYALIDAYLRIGGWRFDIDFTLRIARAVHESGEQRVRFNKIESLVLCVLRLVYHEQMHQASEDARCELRTSDLRERIAQAGRPVGQLHRRTLHDTLRRLHRHSLVTFERGFAAEDQQTFVVTPLIERVLPPDRIADIEERVRAYAARQSTSADDGEDGAELGTDLLEEAET